MPTGLARHLRAKRLFERSPDARYDAMTAGNRGWLPVAALGTSAQRRQRANSLAQNGANRSERGRAPLPQRAVRVTA